MMEFASIRMNNGNVLDGKKIGELTEFIINKFSEEGMTCDEAKVVLEQTKDVVGEYSIVQSIDRKESNTYNQ